jgi:S1-C subfamily serine protease
MTLAARRPSAHFPTRTDFAMTSIVIHCPSCHATLRGPAPTASSVNIRCNKCHTVFRVKAKTAEPSPAVEEPEEERPPARKEKVKEAAMRRPRPETRPEKRRPRDDDDDEEPKERRPLKKRKRSHFGLVLGLSIGGGVGLIVVVVLILVLAWWLPSLNAPPVTATIAPPPPVVMGPQPQEGETPADALLGPEPPQVIDSDPGFHIAPLFNPPPAADAPALAPIPANGAMAADVLDKVKKATVYIRVANDEGVASGSGFFEAGSGQVLTNAHVVGMLHADEEAPKSIEIVLRSGETDEKTLPGKILAVDRTSDLAVLGVDLKAAGLTAPPASLAVASASGLHETQQVYVFGFPFGETLGKNITVSTSSVSSLRKDKDGVLTRVQVNGGMNPGNSGGPVVDAGGNVVGVAVAGIKGTQINFAVPGDRVQTFFRGRCSGIAVGEAFRKDGQIAVPVDVTSIDPMHRMTKFAVDWWTGDPGDGAPPTATPPTAPAAAARRTTPLAYQLDAMTGHVDLILPEPPAAGKVLWVQPKFVDGAGQTIWSAGVAVTVPEPVDARPATLALKPPTGKTRLILKSKATAELRTADGQYHSLLNNIAARLLENIRQGGGARYTLYYDTFEHFDMSILIDGKTPPASSPQASRVQQITQNIRKLALTLTIDSEGDVTQKSNDLSMVPPEARAALNGMGDQVLQSLDVASMRVPSGTVQPGQTWTAKREVPVDTANSYQTAASELTYTYRGVRTVDGQEYAIVNLSGVVKPVKGQGGNASGQIHGTAAIDLAAGRIYQVHALVDVTLDLQFRDETLRGNGILDVNLTRTGP